MCEELLGLRPIAKKGLDAYVKDTMSTELQEGQMHTNLLPMTIGIK